MMAETIPHVLARRLLKKRAAKKIRLSTGSLVGRALVRGGHSFELVSKLKPIELRAGDDPRDYTDPSKVYGSLDAGSRSGLGGKFISNAELGGRLGRDIYRAATGDTGYSPRGESGRFQIVAGSRNTARVTVGPDRRTRRQKYEWEKADTRRKIQKAVLAVTLAGGAAAGIHLYNKGGGAAAGSTFKAVSRGLKQTGTEVVEKTADIGRGIGAVFTGRPYTPRKIGSPGSSESNKKIADLLKERAAAREAAKHSPTPQAEGGHSEPDEKTIRFPKP
jgi:hypothetical protein